MALNVPEPVAAYLAAEEAKGAKYRYVFQTINVQTFGDLVTVRARLTSFLGVLLN